MEARPHIFLISVLPRRGCSRPHPGSFMSTEGSSIPVRWASGSVEMCCRNENRNPISFDASPCFSCIADRIVSAVVWLHDTATSFVQQKRLLSWQFCARAERHVCVLQWTASCHQLPGRTSTLHSLNNLRTPVLKII